MPHAPPCAAPARAPVRPSPPDHPFRPSSHPRQTKNPPVQGGLEKNKTPAIPEDPRNVTCGWDDCKVQFAPRGNQRYCPACGAQARTVHNRENQRRHRLQLTLTAARSHTSAARAAGSAPDPSSPCAPDPRPIPHPTPSRAPARNPPPSPCQQFDKFRTVLFSYKCDQCNTRVLRAPHQLHVFCSPACQTAFQKGRRRMLRRFPRLARSSECDPRQTGSLPVSTLLPASFRGHPLLPRAPPP